MKRTVTDCGSRCSSQFICQQPNAVLGQVRRDPGTEEPESPAAASLVEERLDPVTVEAERSVIATSIVESAFIPTSLEFVVESSIVVVSTGLAELDEARLFTKSDVGIRRSESTTKSECAQAHCAGNHGPGCDFLETHDSNSFVLLSGPTKDCGTFSSISVQVRCVDLIASRDVQGFFSAAQGLPISITAPRKSSMDRRKTCVMEKSWRSRGDNDCGLRRIPWTIRHVHDCLHISGR
jgi:hypothetical protein